MKRPKLKWLITANNAGEVIDKGYWGSGAEQLYTCSRERIACDYQGFPTWKRTTKYDLLLTRNGTPYIHLPMENAIYSNVVQRITVPKHDRRYIKYALEACIADFKGYGVSIESLNFQMWSNLKVPIYDLETQKSSR